MDKEDASSLGGRWTFSFPELSSLLALFFGLFCILCFKKLIVFGRKWKNILSNWGYQTLNVPYLWISDHFTGSDHSPFLPPYAPNNFANFKRLPAIRLPDAWPNFLLTWLYLNVDSMSILTPAWIAAVNEACVQLIRSSSASCKQRVDNSDQPNSTHHLPSLSTPCSRLEVKSVQKPSIPPRLSSIDSSASGSTRELHFHCTVTTPEAFLGLELTRPSSSSSSTAASSEQYLLHLRQLSCRIHMVCAALEEDYVLLSWKLVSPLLTQPLVLLKPDKQPVDQLPSTEVRWIKDTIYLAIQSAVTRVILSPVCLTSVQNSLPVTIQLCKPQPPPSNQLIDRSQEPSISQPLVTDAYPTYLNNLQPLAPHGSSVRVANKMCLRIVYAVLLEPLDSRSVKPLTSHPIYCRVRSNLSLIQSCLGDLSGSASTLATTSGAWLEAKSWSISASNSADRRTVAASPHSVSAVNHVAVWNEDVHM